MSRQIAELQAKNALVKNKLGQTIKLFGCLTKDNHIVRADLDRLVFTSGVPEEVKGFRPLIWRILLNYFPDSDTSDWDSFLAT
jgi:hypothetical protein